MYALITKTLSDFRWTLFWYLLISVGYVGMIVGFYPTVRESAEEFSALVDVYPEVIRESFGIGLESLSTLPGFLSVELFSFMFVIILAVLTFSLGASLVAGEVDRGTAELIFTLPLKRRTVLAGKALAAFGIILAVIAATLLAVTLGGVAVKESLDLGGVGALFITLAAVGFLLLSVTTLLSAVANSRGMVYGTAGGFLVVSYALHILNGFNDSAAGVYAFSFFKYYGNPETILTTGTVDGGALAALIIVGAALFAIAFLVTAERDL